MEGCPDCWVAPGAEHADGCDVARCLVDGLQRLVCQAEHDCGRDTWSGGWPGEREAEEFGVDLNTLYKSRAFRWDPAGRRWVRS